MLGNQNIYPEGYNVSIFMPTTSGLSKSKWQEAYHSGSAFGDGRRFKSFQWLGHRIEQEQSCVINKITHGEGERKRAERFLNNDQIDIKEVIERCCLEVKHPCFTGQDILNVMDQSVLTFADAVGRMKGQESELGVVGNGHHYGQNCVTGLAVRRSDCKILGLSSLLFYSNDTKATCKRERIGRDERPLKYRETEKWVEAAHQASLRAVQAKRLIHVVDRAGDNLNFLIQLFAKGTRLGNAKSTESHIVIRGKENRRVITDEDSPRSGKVRDLIQTQPVVTCYKVNVVEDIRMSYSSSYSQGARKRKVNRVTKRKGRTAKLEVRFLPCKLDGTKLLQGKSRIEKEQLKVHLEKSNFFDKKITYIHVREIECEEQSTAKKNEQNLDQEEAIDWLLITTLPVTEVSEAIEVINIYRQRFPIIEQLYRCAKKDGFNIEAAQFKSLKALQIITAMVMKASALIMKMIQARDEDTGYDITADFNEMEIEVLELCQSKYQGKTIAQSNPHPPDQLSWAVWIIARMGGWKAINKQRKPGPKTLQRGLDKFYAMYEGVALTKGWP